MLVPLLQNVAALKKHHSGPLVEFILSNQEKSRETTYAQATTTTEYGNSPTLDGDPPEGRSTTWGHVNNHK